jgi:DMSO/TMAO reductase YedYZ molybdopterin-dependent catalytic subunit
MALKTRTVIAGVVGGGVGAVVMIRRGGISSSSPGRIGLGTALGAMTGAAIEAVSQIPERVRTLERLMPKTQMATTYKQVCKPTPDELFRNVGTGSDFETRLASLDGFITPNDRFYIRSHSPTPEINVDTWRLTISGTGVKSSTDLTYGDLGEMPQVTLTRTMECSGNGRRFFKEAFGVEGEGGQWRTGAIGCAEWTGVRLRDVLERAGLTGRARNVMPEGLDDHRVSRPMPIEKALKDDTLVVLKMNGETLPPDHGFPARMLVSGWTGTASIKWLGEIHVAEEPLFSPYNTTEYILVGPSYPMQYPALGVPITEMPVMSVIDLDWPAKIRTDTKVIRGRSYAGERRVREVFYKVDGDPWKAAELLPPSIEGCWVCWQFDWEPTHGEHEIRVRAVDDKGRAQPDSVPWNHHGYLYNAVVAHPVSVA